jgi:hypothetical protein
MSMSFHLSLPQLHPILIDVDGRHLSVFVDLDAWFSAYRCVPHEGNWTRRNCLLSVGLQLGFQDSIVFWPLELFGL